MKIKNSAASMASIGILKIPPTHLQHPQNALRGQKQAKIVWILAFSGFSTDSSNKMFGFAGIPTHFKEKSGPISFVAEKCAMVPIEWVTRRLATGSFLKRNPGVPEGFRFAPPCQETFFKDDANHDPQWSLEQILCAKFQLNGVTIGQAEVYAMQRMTLCVFEVFHYKKNKLYLFEPRVVLKVLERAWSTLNCVLVDMKIEFGITEKGQLVVADVIDSDSWRLWPSGDKRLMKDKQVYRDLGTDITQKNLETVKHNFQWVADQLDKLVPEPRGRVI
jgi:phosphoribosylaminoimidazole carboxylase / phosphoribosylaminoimidazole-succinocarboxamide synthase